MEDAHRLGPFRCQRTPLLLCSYSCHKAPGQLQPTMTPPCLASGCKPLKATCASPPPQPLRHCDFGVTRGGGSGPPLCHLSHRPLTNDPYGTSRDLSSGSLCPGLSGHMQVFSVWTVGTLRGPGRASCPGADGRTPCVLQLEG